MSIELTPRSSGRPFFREDLYLYNWSLSAGRRVDDEAVLDSGGDESAEGCEDAEQGQDRHNVHRMLSNFSPRILLYS